MSVGSPGLSQSSSRLRAPRSALLSQSLALPTGSCASVRRAVDACHSRAQNNTLISEVLIKTVKQACVSSHIFFFLIILFDILVNYSENKDIKWAAKARKGCSVNAYSLSVGGTAERWALSLAVFTVRIYTYCQMCPWWILRSLVKYSYPI